MVSQVSAGKGGEESGGGKRPYAPPKVFGLSPVDEGRGAPTRCQSGSGNSNGCLAGNAALYNCTAGNQFFM